MGYMRLAELLAERRGVLTNRDLPNSTLRDHVRRGHLVRLLPGIYCHPALGLQVVARAVALWDPRAVIIGDAAVALTFDPTCQVRTILISTQRRSRCHPRLRMTRTRVPRRWVMPDAPVADPALTALHLAATDDGDAITTALRTRHATMHRIVGVLREWRHRPGNAHRRTLVERCRERPWSVGERRLHDLLRRHRIDGWQGNVRLRISGATYFADVLFKQQRVILEFDGYATHGDAAAFIADRRRQNALQLAGWLVVRFTWADLDDGVGLAETVRRSLELGGSTTPQQRV